MKHILKNQIYISLVKEIVNDHDALKQKKTYNSLYKLSTPLLNDQNISSDYVIISAIDWKISILDEYFQDVQETFVFLQETFVFLADEKGSILSFSELDCSTKNVFDHDEVIKQAGWIKI